MLFLTECGEILPLEWLRPWHSIIGQGMAGDSKELMIAKYKRQTDIKPTDQQMIDSLVLRAWRGAQ